MGDLGIEMGLVKLLQCLIDGIYAAIIGVEHLHLCCCYVLSQRHLLIGYDYWGKR